MRIFPLTPSAAQAAIVSSGGLGDLTPAQLALIQEGSFITTSDGKRWQYKGTGDKTLAASYIIISDETPEWSTIENVPVFTYATPGIVPNSIGSSITKFLKGDGTWSDPTPTIDQVQGLTTALAGKQPTGNYVTRTDVQSGGSSYFERSGDAASQNVGQGQSVHQVVLANDTRLSDPRRVQWFPAPPNFYTIPNGATAGAMAYDGSFLYLLVPMPEGQVLRWARIAMSTTW